MRMKKRNWATIVVVIVGIFAVLAALAWWHLFRSVPVEYSSDEDHFKYGSIGIEANVGMPYWLWLVMPRMFPEKLPGPAGYPSLGIVWEEGQEMPVGFTKVTIGMPRVGVNCAGCHTTSVRKTAEDKPMLILGGPSHQFDIQAYQRFLIACAKDPRFTADAILKELQYVYKLSFVENLFYRYIIIPQTKKGLLDQEKQFSWMNIRPDWGPGRTDMNPFKLMVLKLADDRSVGNSDMMALWNQNKHDGFLRHTDGLNPALIEASYSAALATGATAKSINVAAVKRVNDWLLNLPAALIPVSYQTGSCVERKGSLRRAMRLVSCVRWTESRKAHPVVRNREPIPTGRPLDETGGGRI